MRYRELTPQKSHPYVVSVSIDPVDFYRLSRWIDDGPEVRLLDYDDSEPDCWTVHVGCASREVASRFEDAWG